jgi:hypothetical protein
MLFCGLRYLCPWQRRVTRWKRRAPHAEWPGPVVFLGAEVECSAVVSLDLGARRSDVRLEGDVLTSHSGGACSPLPCGRHGGVLCRVRCSCSGVVFVWWCPLRRVMYQLLLLFK